MDIDYLKEWLDRSLLLGEKEIELGGLSFGIVNEKPFISGLAKEVLVDFKVDYECIHYEYLRFQDSYFVFDLPFEEIGIDWEVLVKQLKKLMYHSHRINVKITGINVLNNTGRIKDIYTLNLPDVEKLGDFVFQDSNVLELYAPKVVELGDKCFCNAGISKLYLDSLGIIGKHEIENLRYLTDLVDLRLRRDYTVIEDGHEELKNGREKLYNFLNLNEFRNLNRNTIQYLLQEKESVYSSSLQRIYTDNKKCGWNSSIYLRKRATYICFENLTKLTSYLFTNLSNYTNIILDKVSEADILSFHKCILGIVYMPSLKSLKERIFCDCQIKELCLVGLQLLDCSCFSACDIKFLYIGKNTVVKNEHLLYGTKIERMSVDDARRFADLYR